MVIFLHRCQKYKMKKTTTLVVVFFLVETTELESVTFRV